METIASQVGDYVKVHGKKRGLKKGMSSKDIFANWDKNGNQHLSKMEFRIAARGATALVLSHRSTNSFEFRFNKIVVI